MVIRTTYKIIRFIYIPAYIHHEHTANLSLLSLSLSLSFSLSHSFLYTWLSVHSLNEISFFLSWPLYSLVHIRFFFFLATFKFLLLALSKYKMNKAGGQLRCASFSSSCSPCTYHHSCWLSGPPYIPMHNLDSVV